MTSIEPFARPAGRHTSRLALALVAAFGFAAAFTPEVRAETLEEALAMAYNVNPQLLSERAKLRATDEQVPQALAGWRPTVQITSSASVASLDVRTAGGPAPTTLSVPGSTITSTGVSSSPGASTVRSLGAQAALTQPVFSGGGTMAQTAQAENTVRAERATLLATEQSVLLSAASAFMSVVRDQTLLDLQIENERVLSEQLRASRAQARAGTALDTDVQLAQSRLSTAIAARQTAEGNLATSRETYQQVVGQAPQHLAYPSKQPTLPGDLEAVKSLAATANPTVLAADYTRLAAIDSVKVVASGLLPSVSLNGTASRATVTQFNDRTTDNLSMGAQVTIPLYEAGAIYSQTRQAQQTVRQQTHALDTARLQAIQAAAAAWDGLSAAHASIESNGDAVAAEEAALRGIVAQYRAGTRSIIDVLNETQTLLTDRINLATAQYNEQVALYQVANAIGRMTAVDLALPVQLYDPNHHYQSVRDKWIGFEASSR